MDLSDSKYINSKNRISTLINNHVYPDTILDYYEFHTKVGVEKILGQVYNPQTTKNVEIIDPLPEGFRFISSGQIAGRANTINGTHQLFNSLIRITDSNDIVRDVTVVIAIISPEFDAASVPPDDPVLQINFSYLYCSSNSSTICPPGTNFGNCINDCGAVGCNQPTCAKPSASRQDCWCSF
jgi:hypothetical protein